MDYVFRWNDWNAEHATRHGVTMAEIEHAVRHYPKRRAGDGRYRVAGRTLAGGWIQVVFTVDPDGTLYVVHARPLTDVEKKRERRR